jgi:hypothetical protein
MIGFPLISSAATDVMVAAAARRYPRPPGSIRLPSSVHTKELTIWGYAA